MMKNLPRPSVTVHEKHSYVTIKMCIADYLAKGYLPATIPTKENKVIKLITDSKFCKGISRRAKYCYRDVSSDNLVVMTGVSWSDDFEPNSMSKNNLGSVWIKTLYSFQIIYIILHLKMKIMMRLKKYCWGIKWTKV